jgi:uridine kinase
VKAYVIAVNAVSGGGKTTLARLLADSLSARLFAFDDYDEDFHPKDLVDWWKRGADLSEFDSPGMYDAVMQAVSDPAVKNIVLDYPFGRDHPRFRNVIDLSVFIDTPLDLAMSRRVLRDFTFDSLVASHERVKHLLEELVHYTERGRNVYLDTYRHKETSDLILDGCLNPEEWRDLVLDRVRSSPDTQLPR